MFWLHHISFFLLLFEPSDLLFGFSQSLFGIRLPLCATMRDLDRQAPMDYALEKRRQQEQPAVDQGKQYLDAIDRYLTERNRRQISGSGSRDSNGGSDGEHRGSGKTDGHIDSSPQRRKLSPLLSDMPCFYRKGDMHAPNHEDPPKRVLFVRGSYPRTD